MKGRSTVVAGLLACAIFVILGSAALSHDLLAPNGLGVIGGKARLFRMARGLPEGFFTDERFAPYQPAYPPGAALLALPLLTLDEALKGPVPGGRAGGGGEARLFAPCAQLLVPASLAFLFLVATRGGSAGEFAVATLLVLSPLGLRLASGFYAEPLAALSLTLGLRRMRHHPHSGALLAGTAALFRLEALLLAPLFALTLTPAISPPQPVNPPAPLKPLLLSLLPGCAWLAFVWAGGGSSGDFDFTTLPSPARIGWTLKALLRIAANPLATGGLAYWFILSATRREMVVAVMALTLGAFALAFNSTPHYGWVLTNTLPRYLWLTLVGLLGASRLATSR